MLLFNFIVVGSVGPLNPDALFGYFFKVAEFGIFPAVAMCVTFVTVTAWVGNYKLWRGASGAPSTKRDAMCSLLPVQ